MRTATKDQIRTELKELSARVYAATGLKGRLGENDTVNFSVCEGKPENVKDAIHFWQVDDLGPDELNPGVEKLREYFKANGWTGIGEKRDAAKVDLEVWARNPENTAAVWAQAFSPKNRVIFRVSTPCFQVLDA
ncbi:hypothetical protein [Kitasatospora albolonga]|uniref:hypothetical protein n=1 Tax=Kitasatospora albolonga TaxID=68173 RepID=UPI0031F0DB84